MVQIQPPQPTEKQAKIDFIAPFKMANFDAGVPIGYHARMIGDGRFPNPMRLGARAKGWPAREIKRHPELLHAQRRRPRQ
ncbi:MAG: AlpA family phage regulatory protein [Hyphomicrobium sp.]|nr:AlpA family phage regulatory protein [Hyphomicrobium sp.]